MIPFEWLKAAEERIHPHIRKTPLRYDSVNDLYLKWENQQVTGSFKVRGALNKVMVLEDWERQRGLVAASAGNHGQGVAFAGSLFSAPVTIFVSESTVPVKIEAMRRLGAEVKLVSGGYTEAEETALAYAADTQATWVSPYNDGQVIAGQGTVGLETLEQLPPLDETTWIVPTSGGGLIAGVGAAIKTETQLEQMSAPKRMLIGVQSEASAFMHAIYHRGSQNGIRELPSIADGLAGAVENGSITVPMVKVLVDGLILVGEADIRGAIRYAWNEYQERIEGSAAVALAAVLSGKITNRPAVLILTGGNIQPEIHDQIAAA